MLGLLIHFRLYPIIYFFSIISRLLGDPVRRDVSDFYIKKNEDTKCRAHLADNDTLCVRGYQNLEIFEEEIIIVQDFIVDRSKNIFSSLRNEKVLSFVLNTFLSFGILTAISLMGFGRKYIEESILYHFNRSDFRHNFSPQFLQLYILRVVESELQSRFVGDNTEFIQFRVAHVYQVILLIVASIYPVYHRKFSPILFIQTIIFVSFNKVVTAQYFLWFGCLLPLYLYQLNVSDMVCEGSHVDHEGGQTISFNGLAIKMMVFDAILWGSLICTWLRYAYILEFHGESYFKVLWVVTIVFHIGQVYVILSCTHLFIISECRRRHTN